MPEVRPSIHEMAYYLWEQEGRPDGREREHWLEAERRCQSGEAAPVVAVSAKKPKPAAKRSAARSPRAGRGSRSDSEKQIQTAP